MSKRRWLVGAGIVFLWFAVSGFWVPWGLPTVGQVLGSRLCVELGCEVNSAVSSAGSFRDDDARAFATHFVSFRDAPGLRADVTTVPVGVWFWRREVTHAVRLSIQEAPPAVTADSVLAGVGGRAWRVLTGREWSGTVTDYCSETRAWGFLNRTCVTQEAPHPFIPGYPGRDIVTIVAWRDR